MQQQPQKFPKFQTSSILESTTTTHPKIKPLLCLSHRWIDIETKKPRKLRVYFSKAVSTYPHGKRVEDSQTLERAVQIFKTPSQLSKVRFQSSQSESFGVMRLLIMKHLSSKLALDLSFSSFWLTNKDQCRILFRRLASFESDANFYLLLNRLYSLKPQLKCLQQFRVFRKVSVSLEGYSNPFGKSIILSSLKKLRKLQQLDLTMHCWENGADEFLGNLALTLPKFSLLRNLHLMIMANPVLQSSLILLFQSFSAMKCLADLSLDFSACTMLSDNQNTKCFDSCLIQKFSLELFKNLDDKSLSQFFQILKNLTQLKTLNLGFSSSDMMTNQSLDEFSSILGTLCSLSSLRLTFTNALKTNNFVQAIASALKSLEKLTHLKFWLHECYSDETQFQHLFLNLRFLKSLRFLDINTGWCQEITDNNLKSLGESFQELDLLQYFSFESYSPSSITDQGGVVLAGRMKHLGSLRSLTLQLVGNTNLTEKTLDELAQSLKSLDSLYSVTLCFKESKKMINLDKLFKTLKEMKNLSVNLWFPGYKFKGQSGKLMNQEKFIYFHYMNNQTQDW